MSEDVTLDEFREADLDRNTGWQESKLEELLTQLLIGNRPTGGGLDEGEYISIGGTQIASEGYIDLHDLVYIPKDYFAKVKNTQLRRHDILMVKDGANTGDVAIAWDSDDRIVTNEHLFTLRATSNINSPYLFYFLLSHRGWKQLNGVITGSAQEGINRGFTGKIDVEYPSLQEQRRIASVLYNVDRAIQNTIKINTQLGRVKSALAQEVFHTGLGDPDLKKGWMGEIPAHWTIQPFSELIEVSQNGIYKEKDDYGGSYPIIKMGDIFGGVTLDEPIRESVHLDEDEVKKYGTSEGDLVFARHAQAGWGAGDCTIIPAMDDVAVVESNMVHVRLTPDVEPMFFAQYFNSEIGVKSIKRITTTGNIKSISQSDLLGLKVPVPPKEEQEEVAKILSVFDDRRDNSDSEIHHLHRIKRGLMQDLLSGKVRTTDTNIEVLPEVAAHG